MSKASDTHELLSHALIGYEEARKGITAKIAELRAKLDGTVEPAVVQKTTPTGRRPMSAAARARMARAQRKGWAAKRKSGATAGTASTTTPAPAAAKRTMSPEGRARIAAAQRKRWATFKKSA
jgi:hypothetical protein